jgi:hypothetical protein
MLHINRKAWDKGHGVYIKLKKMLFREFVAACKPTVVRNDIYGDLGPRKQVL